MLVKVNSIIRRNEGQEEGKEENQYIVRVTKLDIDDLGSVIPLREIELWLPLYDESIVKTLMNSHYAAIFTEGYNEEDGSTIILARGFTEEELNKEKEKTIKKVNEKRRDHTK
ncbi:hypothetical protein NTE_03226 [Candidatus Nitrososphaera evergladensis SR1]|uniref:Uncharacterized protein n=1 Tax=Candidatus Nitrososphaera evergladensis SR1 TaxID=1459636 RepID=A0A075MVJ7_9ARCH|nr:hypothetical protein [Candidatus Nitrososphaera evergladensis]AIF85255.1 hypothetical protein NTE_03226 [Candidatus Nitrososphaera evergladensis SR1]